MTSGLTQAELAKRLDATQSSIAKLESSRSNPRLRTLERALAATGNGLELSLSPSTFPGIDESLIARCLKADPARRLADMQAFYKSMSRSAPGFRPADGS